MTAAGLWAFGITLLGGTMRKLENSVWATGSSRSYRVHDQARQGAGRGERSFWTAPGCRRGRGPSGGEVDHG